MKQDKEAAPAPATAGPVAPAAAPAAASTIEEHAARLGLDPFEIAFVNARFRYGAGQVVEATTYEKNLATARGVPLHASPQTAEEAKAAPEAGPAPAADAPAKAAAK